MGLSNFTYAHTEHGAIAGPLLSYTVHAVAADNATLTPQTYTKFAILSLGARLLPELLRVSLHRCEIDFS